MKTLIVYATKNGGTAEIARQIGDKLEGATLHNLKDEAPNPADFDAVIIGSSIYAGKIRKEAAHFIADNLETLYTKRVGLFICGLKESQSYWQDNFPPRLLAHCKSGKFLGCYYDPKKTGFFDRFVVRAVGKIKTNYNGFDAAKAVELVEAVKNA
ncbi:MAG: flavodoxin domain-containing protein [Defluviitaleaceae bacterium]|nr:flavodoxin domain-containing protein [Defluviitaleaceae bacterium]